MRYGLTLILSIALLFGGCKSKKNILTDCRWKIISEEKINGKTERFTTYRYNSFEDDIDFTIGSDLHISYPKGKINTSYELKGNEIWSLEGSRKLFDIIELTEERMILKQFYHNGEEISNGLTLMFANILNENSELYIKKLSYQETEVLDRQKEEQTIVENNVEEAPIKNISTDIPQQTTPKYAVVTISVIRNVIADIHNQYLKSYYYISKPFEINDVSDDELAKIKDNAESKIATMYDENYNFYPSVKIFDSYAQASKSNNETKTIKDNVKSFVYENSYYEIR